MVEVQNQKIHRLKLLSEKQSLGSCWHGTPTIWFFSFWSWRLDNGQSYPILLPNWLVQKYIWQDLYLYCLLIGWRIAMTNSRSISLTLGHIHIYEWEYKWQNIFWHLYSPSGANAVAGGDFPTICLLSTKTLLNLHFIELQYSSPHIPR